MSARRSVRHALSQAAQEPFNRTLRHFIRYRMAANELDILYRISRFAQARRDGLAAGPDRQYIVVRAVRDKDARLAFSTDRRDESGRKGNHMTEQVAVCQADRQRIRSAIGKAADRRVAGIYRVEAERMGQDLINQRRVRSV